MPDQPVAHLARPVPPWDEVRHTLCGRLIVDVARMGTPEAYTATVKKHGQRRAAFDYCVTCIDRGPYTEAKWEQSAVEIALDWLGRSRYARDGSRDNVTTTLHALSALVEAHPEEFEAHRNATKSGAKSLDAARTARKNHLRGLP